ncbi:putative MAPEG superfamily protein [Sinobacterium caligoides]|uniref:Putative MAPEG superfamily protein n=1 Tax=Sinobacterium caligoides TaxID=933926 RepID=A0A3N2DZV0_9GAMM|nr:MAPEG family protein [Sinobacterium caligoides]ROS05358.1 putative MAPEG superfamily protein [Sinobacterium caligoides]
MDLINSYSLALSGLFVILSTLVLQTLIAAFSKASQPGAVPGKIDPELSHESFVFRANRTLANSLENIPAMLGSSILAILVGVDSHWCGILIWIFALSRLLHMVLYYSIATEKNPSPRSYFYLSGLVANIILLILIGKILTSYFLR